VTAAYSILVQAAGSKKGGIRVSADPSTLATLFNALRKERQRYQGTFGHLVFKRRPTHINILNGKNIEDNLEEIFDGPRPRSAST
jgi:hypothetical protein